MSISFPHAVWSFPVKYYDQISELSFALCGKRFRTVSTYLSMRLAYVDGSVNTSMRSPRTKSQGRVLTKNGALDLATAREKSVLSSRFLSDGCCTGIR